MHSSGEDDYGIDALFAEEASGDQSGAEPPVSWWDRGQKRQHEKEGTSRAPGAVGLAGRVGEGEIGDLAEAEGAVGEPFEAERGSGGLGVGVDVSVGDRLVDGVEEARLAPVVTHLDPIAGIIDAEAGGPTGEGFGDGAASRD